MYFYQFQALYLGLCGRKIFVKKPTSQSLGFWSDFWSVGSIYFRFLISNHSKPFNFQTKCLCDETHRDKCPIVFYYCGCIHLCYKFVVLLSKHHFRVSLLHTSPFSFCNGLPFLTVSSQSTLPVKHFRYGTNRTCVSSVFINKRLCVWEYYIWAVYFYRNRHYLFQP